jgi:hypothetical protein
VFPFYTWSFTIWLVVVDPYFVTSDNAMQNPHYSGSGDGYKYPNGHTCSVPCVVLESILHIVQVKSCGRFHRQNSNYSAAGLLLLFSRIIV